MTVVWNDELYTTEGTDTPELRPCLLSRHAGIYPLGFCSHNRHRGPYNPLQADRSQDRHRNEGIRLRPSAWAATLLRPRSKFRRNAASTPYVF